MNKTQTSSIAETKPRRLGRGLSALLGEPVAIQATPKHVSPPPATHPPIAEPKPAAIPVPPPQPEAADSGRVIQVPVTAIEPNQFQPRRTFDEAQLAELAASIKSAGVVQPILVRPAATRTSTVAGVGGAARFELIAGERRWRACKLAGLTHVPAVVSKLNDEQAAEWALIENIQRSDLSPMERAWAIRGLCERFGFSHAQVGEKLGIDRTSAANLARLTELEQEIRDLLDSNQLSAGHGKALLSAPAGSSRITLAKQAAAQGWSVRRLEQAVGGGANRSTTSISIPGPVGESALAKTNSLRELEKQLSDHLGSNVRIRATPGSKRGSLVIKFYDLDHFDGLMAKLGFRLK
jgi:ParB family chromosome partitioning protein